MKIESVLMIRFRSLWVCLLLILAAGCRAGAATGEPKVAAPPTPLATAIDVEMASPPGEQGATPSPASPSTASPAPTTTSSATPSPTASAIACIDDAPELEKPFPVASDLQMDSSHTFLDGDFVYLATQNYLGLIDTSVPAQPRFLGFWQLTQSEEVTDILAHNSVLYVSSGSTVYLLNLNPHCRFSPIAQLELPFNVARLEVEDDRFYVGGKNEQLNTEHLAIFTVQSPVQLEQVGLLDLGEEPVRWSVSNNDVFLLSGVELSAIDVSDPTAPVTRPIDVGMNSEYLVRQPREMVDNAFYFYSPQEGQSAVRELDQIPPYLQTTPNQYALDSVTRAVIDSMQIDRDYIFLGSNWCDVECASIVNVISRESFEPLAVKGFQPHYPIHAYVEITKELIYAFANDHVLVLDLSDLEHPSIIWTVPLTV